MLFYPIFNHIKITSINTDLGLILHFPRANTAFRGEIPLHTVPEVWLLPPNTGTFSLDALCVMQRSLMHNSRNLITKLRPMHVGSPVYVREPTGTHARTDEPTCAGQGFT